MYKIGDFAKIVDISVRTLRYYDEFGILQPSEIDDFTGYRYYSDDNVIECEFIKLLKSLEFTLEEIKQYKYHLDEEIVEKKKKEIEERIYLLRLKYERLSLIQEQIKQKKEITKNINKDSNEMVLRRKYEKRNIGKSL